MKINRKLAVFSWAMYDFANTIFSMNVITLYFALWVTVDMKGEDILYSFSLSGSMLLAALTAPVMGTISDKLSKRMPFLIIFTLISCISTVLIGLTTSLVMGLLAFAVANYGFQLGSVFYNSLLPQVSEPGKIGRVSGFGAGLGYFGTIAGLVLVGPFALHYGRQAAFIPTGILFFLFALPCFLFVKDVSPRYSHEIVNESGNIIIAAFKKIKETIINIKNYSGLLRFLIAIFIAFNAINTAFVFMSVYTEKVIGFTDSEILVFYIVSSIFAILGAFFIGFVTDRFGAKRTLTGVLCLWCVAAFLVIISVNKLVFCIVGPLVGISLGGTWTSARTMVVDLSPPSMVGEVFGFYGLVGKTATIIGPLVWGSCVWGFGFLGIIKYRIAVFALLLFLIIGLIILQKVPEMSIKHD